MSQSTQILTCQDYHVITVSGSDTLYFKGIMTKNQMALETIHRQHFQMHFSNEKFEFQIKFEWNTFLNI